MAKHSKHTWHAIPAADRYGLTYEECKRVVDEYGLVAAMPITGKSGILSRYLTIDTPKGTTLAQKERVQISMATVANQVASILKL